MKETIYNLLNTKFNIDSSTINESDQLRELGLDSLEMVALIIELENIFDTSIPDEEMVNLKTIQDIFNLLKI
jgi:acyl carrier protein